MNPQSWEDDDLLQLDLGAAVRAGDQVPRRFAQLGKLAFTWQGIDAELAELSYDSAAAGTPNRLAVARGDDSVLRALTFSAGELVLEIEITADAVRGQLLGGDIDLPSAAGLVALTAEDGASSTAVLDEDGWFAVAPVPTQPFTLTVRTGSGASIRTGSIAP